MKPALFLASIAAISSFAATPVQLDALMKSGQALTIVDLRSTDDYQRGHITGAINIPHRVIAEKRLPPLGKVIVYCDGLGSTYAAGCVTALNEKPGIQAEALEGGYAGWETFTNVTAEATSVQKQTPRTITYEELQVTNGQNVVIVDVRRDLTPLANAKGETPKEKLDLGTFWQKSLPRASVTTDAFGQLARLKGGERRFSGAPSLIVVIDNDHESAMSTARRIQQSGYKRVVVLAGGEEIIRRDGRAGMARQGAAAPVTLDPTLKPQPVPTIK